MRVRRAREGDAAALRALRLRALRGAPGAFCARPETEERRPDDHWIRLARGDEAGAMFVVDPGDGALAGMAGGRFERPGVVLLWGMWLDPEARGRGAGEALIDAVASWARDAGAERVELAVTNLAGDAERLYRRVGFDVVDGPVPVEHPLATSQVVMSRRV